MYVSQHARSLLHAQCVRYCSIRAVHWQAKIRGGEEPQDVITALMVSNPALAQMILANLSALKELVSGPGPKL